MIKTGGRMSKVDPTVFSWYDDKGKLIGVLAAHVDDFIWGGTIQFEQIVVEHVRQTLNVGKENQESFKYLGLELLHSRNGISAHQESFVSSLVPIQVNKARSLEKHFAVTEDERQELHSKVGQLLWVARQTRPDIIYDTTILASRVKSANVNDLLEANKLIKRVKSESVSLKFQDLGTNNLHLLVYSDASLGNADNNGSQGGQIVFLAGEGEKCIPICWRSRKIRRVVRSTLAAETLSMADGIDLGVFLATLFCELNYGVANPKLLPIKCVIDCKSLFDAVKSTKSVTEKRLRLELSAIKESLNNKQVIDVKWVESNKQLADCLTKHGSSPMKLLRVLETGRFS